eukprot:scaffold613_cov243-Pinguiococcus_pyrenoidosus.AAC.28
MQRKAIAVRRAADRRAADRMRCCGTHLHHGARADQFGDLLGALDAVLVGLVAPVALQALEEPLMLLLLPAALVVRTRGLVRPAARLAGRRGHGARVAHESQLGRLVPSVDDLWHLQPPGRDFLVFEKRCAEFKGKRI